MAFAQTHNEAVPAGTDYIRDGDDAIRNYKICMRERLAVDHYFYSDETGYTNVGMHKQVTLGERATDPTNVTDFGFLYTKNDGGDTELYYMDAAGNVIQLTADGITYGSDNYLLADGTVPLTADWDAGDYQIRAKQFYADVPTGTAPFVVDSTTKVDNLNAEYVGGLLASQLGVFGSWASKSVDTVYLAATDGFACGVYTTGAANGTITGKTDSSSPPTTVRMTDASGSETSVRKVTGICFPVKKGEYWRIEDDTITVTGVYWMPTGA